MECSNCKDKITEVTARYAYDDAYCDDCFDDLFNYCSRCDLIIIRNDSYYDDVGDPYCVSCWEDFYDDDAPENPDVYETDREAIVSLSRNWLKGDLDFKRCISINRRDFYLKDIRNKVGPVEEPLYLYGLIDREEYQVIASSNIINQVAEQMIINGIPGRVKEDKGVNRLGISLSLRKEHLPEIIEIIKQLTVKEEAAVLQ